MTDLLTGIPSWVNLLLGPTGLVLLVTAFLVHRATRKRDSADEKGAQRRDTVADRDSLIDQLQEDMKDMRTRMSSIEREYEIEREWNRTLVDHIFRQLPPPPPARPVRA